MGTLEGPSAGENGGDDYITIEVISDESPQLPLRILGLCAQQSVIAHRFEYSRINGQLHLRLVVTDWSSHMAELAAEKMRGMIGVVKVKTSCKASDAAAFSLRTAWTCRD